MRGLVLILLVLLALTWAGGGRSSQALIEDTTKSQMHNADYQRCIGVHNGPLKPPPRPMPRSNARPEIA